MSIGLVLLSAAAGAAALRGPGVWRAAGADGIQARPVIAESTHFVVLCHGGQACDPKAPPSVVALRNKEAQSVATKADDILGWLTTLGFGGLHIDSRAGKFVLSVDGDKVCSRNNPGATVTEACHRDSITRCSGGCREVILPESGLLAGEFSGQADPVAGDTIAHELSHGLNRRALRATDPLWLDEAVADAIGRAWASRGTGRPHLGYLMSLDLPFYKGPAGGYEKSAYLEFVGRKLGSQDLVAYLSAFHDIRDDTQHGMTYLYDKTSGQKLDALFPEFVAAYNSLDATAPPGGDFYDSYRQESIVVPGAGNAFSKVFAGSVQDFAVDPTHFHTLTVNGTAPEPKDQLMVAEYEITKAARLGDTQLVYEHIVAAGRKHRFIFAGDATIDGGFVRVTNVGATAAATSAQGYELTFRASPVAFTMPLCVATGGTADIEVEGDLAGATNWRLKPAAGTIKGVTFTAPAKPGPVAVELEITSEITRQSGTIAQATPTVRTIALGDIEVHAGVCDIRLEFEGESMALTYSLTGDFVEYSYPDGNRVYVGDNRLAAYTKGAWMSIPPVALKSMLGMFNRRVDTPAMTRTPPWATPDPHMMRRVPKVLSEWYAWAGVTAFLHPGVPARSVGTAVPCPLGGKGCVLLTYKDAGGSAEMIYNDKRQIEQLTVDGRSLVFSYGHMNIQTPPGWVK